MKITSGKTLNDEEYAVELAKLNEMKRKKVIISMSKHDDINFILNALKNVDKVSIDLDEETQLQLHHNLMYSINGQLFRAKTNQQYKLYINFLLNC